MVAGVPAIIYNSFSQEKMEGERQTGFPESATQKLMLILHWFTFAGQAGK